MLLKYINQFKVVEALAETTHCIDLTEGYRYEARSEDQNLYSVMIDLQDEVVNRYFTKRWPYLEKFSKICFVKVEILM